MKKLAVLFICCCATGAFAQRQPVRILAEFRINQLVNEEDTLRLTTPFIIRLDHIGATGIVLLPQIGPTEIGVQYELRQSDIDTNELVLGIAYYERQRGSRKWDDHFFIAYDLAMSEGLTDPARFYDDRFLSYSFSHDNGRFVMDYERRCVMLR